MNIESKIDFHMWASIRGRLRDSLESFIDRDVDYYAQHDVIDEVFEPVCQSADDSVKNSVRTAIEEYEY
jgi:hypothetical protein